MAAWRSSPRAAALPPIGHRRGRRAPRPRPGPSPSAARSRRRRSSRNGSRRRHRSHPWPCGGAGPRPSATIATMTVPGRVEAASLLLSLDPPTWFLRHARAVAEVAGFLAARIDDDGVAVDRRLVEAAALLHDVDKM